MTDQTTQTYVDDEIDLKELFATLWGSKKLIISITILFMFLGATYALLQTNIYRATTVLASVSGENKSNGLMSQFGGLASLAGVSLPSAGGDRATLAIEVIQSHAFLQALIDKYNILPALMATYDVDENKQPVFNPEMFDVIEHQWLESTPLFGEKPTSLKPSLQKAFKTYQSNLSVIQDKDTGFIKVSFEHSSPVFAKDIVNYIVKEANDNIRKNDVKEAQNSIAFLNEQIQKTSISEVKMGLYELVRQQTKTIMVSQANQEYVFRTIDPPLVPEEKFKPKRALIVVLFMMLGGMLSVMYVLIRKYVS